MSCTFKCTMAFVLGAAAGSAVAWKLLKTKYEQIAQDEINSVKEVFARREKENAIDEHADIFGDGMVKDTNEDKEEEVVEYKKNVKTNGYTNYSELSKEQKEVDPGVASKPYVISPSEFGELDDYDTYSLTYYDDHVLTDEDDEIVEDVESVVGFESLNHFGDYEDDSVFVRNEARKCDYEILYDTRKYTDVIRRKPHQMED